MIIGTIFKNWDQDLNKNYFAVGSVDELMKRAVVTGGGGFIGSYVAKKLVALGWKVVVIDNFIRGAKNRLEKYQGSIKIIECDIRDESAIRKLCMDRIGFIIRCSQWNRKFYNKPDLVLDVGIGILSIVEGCRSCNVKG